jgi:hypothetical protein
MEVLTRRLAVVLLGACSIPILSAAWVGYSARYRSDGTTFYYGSDHVFVGGDDGGDGRWIGWDWEHEPSGWRNNGTSGAMVEKWDFENITCVGSTDLCSGTGIQLPDGVEVRLGVSTAGTMPSGLYSSWPASTHRKQVYYTVSTTPATVNTGTGTFKLSLTRGGSAIDIGDGSGVKMTFAGWQHVMQLRVVPYVPVSIDTSTDILTTVEADGTTPRAHGLSSGNSLFFVKTKTNTLPSGLALFGPGSKYCVAVVDTTSFRVRPQINSDTSCPSTNVPPSHTGTMSCTPSGGSSNCQILTGTFPGQTMAFKLTAITSGSPTNVSIDTPYWTLYPVSNPAPYFAFAATGQDAINEDKLLPDAAFTANFETLFQDFTETGTGAAVWTSSFGNGGNFYIREINGYPQGTLFDCRQLGYIKAGTLRNSSSDQFCGVDNSQGAAGLVAKVPAISDAGDYAVDIVFGPNPTGTYTDEQTFSFTLHAVEIAPLTRANPTPASFTAVTGLSQWEQLMVDSVSGGRGRDEVARQWLACTPTTRTSFQAQYNHFVVEDPDGTGPGNDLTPGSLNYWFTAYDRAQFYARKIYYDSADYQFQAWSSTVADQSNFNNCGDYLSWWYATQLDTSPSQEACCAITGNWGLYKAYGRWRGQPGDPSGQYGEKYKQAILRASQAGNLFLAMGRTSDSGTREMSWSTEMWLLQSKMNNKLLPYLKDAIDVQIMWMYEWAVDGVTPILHEPFMAGLTEAALTDYYKHVHRDPRIPIVLKMYSDKHWSSWINPTTYQSYYNVYPYGEQGYLGIGNQVYTSPDLNSYLTALNWFVWRYTGDNTYRDRGDLMFEHKWDDGVPYTAKQSNQAYFRNLDGIGWRTKKTNPW